MMGFTWRYLYGCRLSVKKNIAANYASQVYVTSAGILVLPLYMKYMGPELYGLVGFFMMLQALFGFLDVGLTPTIGRETARYYGGSISPLAYRQLVRMLSLVFVIIAMLGGGSVFFLASTMAEDWLQVEALTTDEVVVAIEIMAASIAMRWMGGLYRGVVTGAERLVWLSAFNILIATLRFVTVFASMALWGFTAKIFFLHQLAVALFELFSLWWMSQRLLPRTSLLEGSIGWSFKPIRSVLNFSLAVAFTSAVWLLFTQADKLILSGLLSLADYGYFTLAVLVASGVIIVGGPVSSAIMPRLARLHAEGKQKEIIRIYRNSTQFVSVFAGSAAITIFFTAEALLFAWTGDREIVNAAAPILKIYALGNGIIAVSAFPYYLQYAFGTLRYHIIGSVLLIIILVPAIIWSATLYGGVGAASVWLGINLLYLLTWVSLVHNKILPGINKLWFTRDIISSPVIFLFFVVLMWFASYTPPDRLAAFYYIVAVAFGVFTSMSLLQLAIRKNDS